MSDGANIGVTAERALGTVLGGQEQPQEEERMSTGQFKDWILSAETVDSYDDSARMAAKYVIEWLLEDPKRAQFPVENEYEKDADGHIIFEGGMRLTEKGWYDRMKEDGVPLEQLGLSGFQWGWAANAARTCLEMPSVPNPAIVTIGGGE